MFSVTDGYLFTVIETGRLDFTNWRVIRQYLVRVGARPKVIAAMKSEGLM